MTTLIRGIMLPWLDFFGCLGFRETQFPSEFPSSCPYESPLLGYDPIWGLPKKIRLGLLFCGPYGKDYSILGSILGSPVVV